MCSLFRLQQIQMFCLLAVLLMCPLTTFAEEATVPQQVLDLQQAASQSLAEGDTAGALESYQAIIQVFPGTEYAMDAQADMAVTYLEAGDHAKVNTATILLCDVYKNQPKAVDAIEKVAYTYVRKKDYNSATSIFTEGVQKLTEHPKRVQLKLGIIACHIRKGDFTASESAIDQLCQQDFDDPIIVDALRFIAGRYRFVKEYDKSLNVCQRALTQFPSHEDGVLIQEEIVCVHLGRGDLDSATQSLDTLRTRCPAAADSFMTAAIKVIWAYEGTNDSVTVIELCNQVLATCPNHDQSPVVRAAFVRAYLKQGDLAKATELANELLTGDSTCQTYVRQVHKVGNAFVNKRDYATGMKLYQSLLTRFPDDEEAANIQASVIQGYFKLKDMAQAELKTEELFTKHIQPADSFMTAINKVIRTYGRINDSGKVIELCNRVLTTHPDHEQSLPVRTKLVKEYLECNSKAQADGITNQVLQKHSDHPGFARSLNEIANGYRKEKYYPHSIELFQAALNKVGDNKDDQLNAYAGMAKAAVYMQETVTDPNAPTLNAPDVDAIVQQLMTDYKDAKKLGFHVFQIGEQYYFRAEKALKDKDTARANADFQKAIAIWEKNINQIADSHHQAMATYYSALAHQRTGDPEKAIACYQQVVDKHPDYEKAWHAQYVIAKHYEKQAAQGQTSTEQVRQAYQTLLDKYPDSSAAKIASKKLSTL